MKTIVHAGLALVILASAGPAIAQEAPITTRSGTLGEPAAGKGQVVFFRPSSIVGGALGCTVREGAGAAETEVARLGSGKYYIVQATPGAHRYFTKGEVTDRLDMEIEEGGTYFATCKIGVGIVAGRGNLSPSDRATFAKKAKGLTMWKGPKAEKID
jgi:hypothetical protein